MPIYPLSDESKAFIQEHSHEQAATLLFKAHRYPHLPVAELVAQIQARQKAKIKLPDWCKYPDVVFPPSLSLEQGSSQQTAMFKASLMQGESLADLTGGMGVDTALLATRFKEVYHIERQAELQALTAHNFGVMGIHNVRFVNADALVWLDSLAPSQHFSWIYLDPHRRDDVGQKVVRLQDCEPNILACKDALLRRADNLLLKASPMLDIDQALRAMPETVAVWVVAVENEVKEILFHLSNQLVLEPSIKAVALAKNNTLQVFEGIKSQESYSPLAWHSPLRYMYEPNVALLKTGLFKQIAHQWHLYKIASNSHLYTSENLERTFIGRSFEVLAVTKLDKKELKPFVPANKANITVRNFPMTVQQIREKLKLQEGGDTYLLATTDSQGKKIIVVCKRVGQTHD